MENNLKLTIEDLEEESNPMITFAKNIENTLYSYDIVCKQWNDETPLAVDHISGSCIVLFKGDYKMCEEIKKYILTRRYDN